MGEVGGNIAIVATRFIASFARSFVPGDLSHPFFILASLLKIFQNIITRLIPARRIWHVFDAMNRVGTELAHVNIFLLRFVDCGIILLNKFLKISGTENR